MVNGHRINNLLVRYMIVIIDTILNWQWLDFTNLDMFIMTSRDFPNNLTSIFRYHILTEDPRHLKNDYNMDVTYINLDNGLYPKNTGYDEFCKMYWIYMNGYNYFKTYIGFNTGKQFFEFLDNIPDMNEIFKEHDVILPYKKPYYKNMSYYDEFRVLHGPYINEVLEIVRKEFPEYYQTAMDLKHQKEGYQSNIFIMKQTDFIKFGQFVFRVLVKWDKLHNLKDDKDIATFIDSERAKKIPGVTTNDIRFQIQIEKHLGTCLANIFFHHYFKNPKHMNIVTIDNSPDIIRIPPIDKTGQNQQNDKKRYTSQKSHKKKKKK